VQFRRLGGRVLLTNETGRFADLTEEQFRSFAAGTLPEDDPLFTDLCRRGFVRDRLDFPEVAAAYLKRSGPLFHSGPSLHMMVVTLRCNQACHYCHSSAVSPSRTDTDMDLETARRTVDFIFDTPNPTICIEFQGGEPMLNWPVVKFVVQYARLKNKAYKKRLILALVSNFTLMNEERLQFLQENYVSLCTSLDGPPELHDQNRPFLGGGAAQEKVVGWLKTIRERCELRPEKRYYLPGALMTTTRFSLPKHKEIVDLYAGLGLEQIFIRPLSPIGYAKRVWDKIGYSVEDYLEFYERSLTYILELNRSGKMLVERKALVLLTKILRGEDPGYMDLRSPAGAVLGCLAYNYDGRIFVSDEGRMVDHSGDERFCVGQIGKSSWADVVDHPTTKACVMASTLDSQPLCAQCAYKPYCGVEPVFHYETQRSVWGQLPSSDWCRGWMGAFDIIFEKLRSPEDRKIFESWLEADRCRWQEGGLPEEDLRDDDRVPA
jgi:His-Xaa-Ser system radical SAM maturase HxsB